MDFNSLQAEATGLGVLLARGAAKRAKVTLADHVDEMGDVTEKAIFRRPESTEMDAALDAVDDLFSATVSSDWDDAFTRAQAVFRDLDDDCQGALQAWREVEMIRRQVADGEMDPTIGRLSADMTLAAFGRSLGAPISAAGAEPDGWDADGADILYAMVALSGRQTSAWEPEPQLPSLDHEIARADKPETLRKNASALGKNELGQNTLLRQSVKVDDQPWRVLDIAGLKGKRVPVRQWIVPQWLPTKVVTLHYADGGVGKTLLALQLMAACASGRKWCGLPVTPCKSVGLFSEDDSEELHARIDGIRERYGLSFDDLAGMCPIDGTGQDNTLVRFERDGRMVLTPRYHCLRQQALDIGAGLVVIDTAATTFGGNEIDRAQVTAFVGTALTSLAQDTNGAVLLNAHPSLSGISSGDLRSGSTAWNNSCRSRWALNRPTDEAGKPDLRSPDRILTRQKANAASTGDTVDMRWERGVFVLPTGAVADGGRKAQAEAAFLAGLRAKRSADLHVSESSKAGNYAPTVLVNTTECGDFKKGELIEAMRNMLKKGIIASRTYRRNSKTFEELIVVADVEQEEEDDEQGDGDGDVDQGEDDATE